MFLHGLGGNGALWRPISAFLEDQYAILLPDQRGHGLSTLSNQELPLADFSVESYGQDILETLDEALEGTLLNSNFPTNLSTPLPLWVVGHSMGVRSTLGFVHLLDTQNKSASPLQAPRFDLKGICLIDLGFSGLAGGGLGMGLYEFLKILPESFNSRTEAKDFLFNHSPDLSIAQYLLAVSVKHQSPEKITFPFQKEALLKTILAASKAPLKEWLKTFSQQQLLKNPTLNCAFILRGANSQVYSETDFIQDQADLKDCTNIKWESMPGCGHGLPFEKRSEFLKSLTAWILTTQST